MKQAFISVQLKYEFQDDTNDDYIRQFLQEVELPPQYQEDTFEYIGIYNTTTEKWVEEE